SLVGHPPVPSCSPTSSAASQASGLVPPSPFDLADLLANPLDHLLIGTRMCIVVLQDVLQFGERTRHALKLLDELQAFELLVRIVAIVIRLSANMPAVQHAFLLIKPNGVGRETSLVGYLLKPHRHLPLRMPCRRVYFIV